MFKIKAESGMARAGELRTRHGTVKTPCFKAVATKGAVKLITSDDLKEMGAQAVISNSFILSMRPGLGVIEKHGGLHKFMDWDGAIYTDCGGFQVMSLEENFHLKTSSEGIEFKSPFDGKRHKLTPSKVLDIQATLGSDVAMALDHMPLCGCSRDEAIESIKNTHRWMEECKRLHEKSGVKQLLFGIAQGSVFRDLRKKSVRFIDSLDFDGIAFGGLALGEPVDKMFEMIKIGSMNCSREKPRYVMGLGSPPSILRAISLGVDTFDSVYPTRNARHAHLFSRDGPLNIDNAQYKEDYDPVCPECKCFVCKRHTRSYISHLFRTREPLGLRLASYHNLFFIQQMLREARKEIAGGTFNGYMKDFLGRYDGRV